jgi:glycosyltransferase involved in cell wall biosynthesis
MTPDMMVSIACITYNHEKFIAKALEGFVSQKTSFKLEIIIADDNSTDGTPKIIKEYHTKYPDLIRPVLRDVNIGSRRNALETLNMCKGDYIALCEGDDYWIDNKKIQKQVEFLEKNHDFVMCTHNVKVEFDNVARINPLKKPLKV